MKVFLAIITLLLIFTNVSCECGSVCLGLANHEQNDMLAARSEFLADGEEGAKRRFEP